MVFLREDTYELVFTSDNPVVARSFKDGTTGKLAPVDLADENVVDIAAPRADLEGGMAVLLGLLQSSFAPKIIVVGMISGKTGWKLKSYGKHCCH